MANIKFSQFTDQTSFTGVEDLVGYSPSGVNIRISPGNLISTYLLNQSQVGFGGSIELSGTIANPTIFNADGFVSNQVVNFKGSARFDDNAVMRFGGPTGTGDLSIYHDAVVTGDSIISDIGPGNLQITGKQKIELREQINGAFYAVFNENGSSQLYWNNSLKLETTSTGVNINGNPAVTASTTYGGNGVGFVNANGTGLSSSAEFTVFPTLSGSGGPLVGLGLNGAAPTKGAVEVNTFLDYNSGAAFDYFLYTGAGGPFQNFAGADAFPISVWGVGRFMGAGIHIYSDERIKKDISVSDSKEDLETISKIEISNYKYIDPAKGTGDNKKVIAQQVQEHYPLAVNEGKEIIPNVFTQSTIADGVINLSVDCKVGDKLKLIYPGNKEEIVKVIQVNKDSVEVDSTKAGDVIVYGKEVDDYKTVDYDALSMLNISATQELYKIIKKLSKEIEQLKSQKNT